MLPVISSLITADTCSFVTSSLASYWRGPTFESRPRDRLPLDLLMLHLSFSLRWLWIMYLMGCNAVWSARSLPTFRRYILFHVNLLATCLLSVLKMEIVRSPETKVPFYQTTRRQIPEDCRENRRSQSTIYFVGCPSGVVLKAWP
jgi:hypothetical protein